MYIQTDRTALEVPMPPLFAWTLAISACILVICLTFLIVCLTAATIQAIISDWRHRR